MTNGFGCTLFMSQEERRMLPLTSQFQLAPVRCKVTPGVCFFMYLQVLFGHPLDHELMQVLWTSLDPNILA